MLRPGPRERQRGVRRERVVGSDVGGEHRGKDAKCHDYGTDRTQRIAAREKPQFRPASIDVCAGPGQFRTVVDAAHDTISGSICVFDPWVQRCVQHIDGKIDQNYDNGDIHDYILHYGIIAPTDGFDKKSRYSWNIKYS